MQATDATWAALVASGDFMVETVAEIGGVEYASISAPVIERGLMEGGLTVGNVCAASMRLSIRTDDEIGRGAAVILKNRLTDGETVSGWVTQGTFYISRRTRDPVTGLIALECYDGMLKANAAYPQTGSYPKAMADVVAEIAQTMGVTVDSRTAIRTGDDYMVPLPDANTSMHDVLAGIAGAHGGNWIISPAGELRLVRMNESGGAVDVIGITGSVTIGKAQTITGLRVQTDTGPQMYGTDDGAVVSTSTPYLTQGGVEWLTSWLLGMAYQPYALAGAIYDPAAELGDTLTSREDVTSVLVVERAAYNLAFRGELGAPDTAEIEDEYPYIGATETMKQEIRRLNRIVADSVTTEELDAVNARLNSLSVDDIRAGVIHSADYAVEQIPLLYPAADVYPAGDIYPSNGEYVTSGFAIDFGTGQIYGGIYSGEMDAMKAAIQALQAAVVALQNQLTYPKA
jgi:hypothetical protein